GDQAGKHEDRECVHRVQEPEARNGRAEPGEDDLEDKADRESKREPDSGTPEARSERDHEQDEPAEYDDVAEARVEVPAVVEPFVAEHVALVLELVRRVEGPVAGGA